MLSSFLNSDAFREIFQSMSEGFIVVDGQGFIVRGLSKFSPMITLNLICNEKNTID